MTHNEIEMAKRAGMINDLYGQRVTELIRERYSLNSELAILRQREDKPKEFEAYNTYAEECKNQAKKELGL